MFIPALILLVYALIFVGAIVLTIWAIQNRVKEKKVEKEKHKDYDKY
ncbi:MAG: hypothetical protein RR620_04275 [Clostridium sp.]